VYVLVDDSTIVTFVTLEIVSREVSDISFAPRL